MEGSGKRDLAELGLGSGLGKIAGNLSLNKFGAGKVDKTLQRKKGEVLLS